MGAGMIRFVAKQQAQVPAALLEMELPEILVNLLVSRGIKDKEDAERFLSPSVAHLVDPMSLSDMAQAVRTLEQALADQQRILIYGDYDVDGVCSIAILWTYLKKRGAQVSHYIPSRHDEGYGLNEDAIRSFAGQVDLLVTVDCGITSAKEVALAQELGMQVIITDHHQLGETMPACAAVVNPILAGYAFPKLCGAGVAWKLVWAMGGAEAAMPLVDLAALATVADLVPLLGENRVIVKEGLARMQQCERPGLRALIEVAGLAGREITSGHLGYQVAPRLNAAGRLKDASQGVLLLTARDPLKAAGVAAELDQNNQRRRELEQRMLEEALAMVPREVDFQKQRCIVLCGEGWNEGVIGLVASRLVDRFRWPVLMLAKQGDHCTGSARSISGINIHTALWECKDLFTRFGGHAAAAGLSMPHANLEALRKRLSDAIAEQEDADTFLPKESYDAELSLGDVDEALVALVGRLAPTGMGNPAPVLLARGVSPVTPRCVGKEQEHLKLQLTENGETRDAIAFRLGGMVKQLPDPVDVLFAPSVNTWNDQTTVQMEVKGLKATAPAKSFRDLCMRQEPTFLRAILSQFLYNRNITENVTDDERILYRSAQDMDDTLREAMEGTRQGVLMIAQTLPAVRKWIIRLNVLGTELDYVMGRTEDPRMFHTLLAAPEMQAEPVAQPRVVALLDGAFAQEQLAAYSRIYPTAQILVAEDAAHQRAQALQALTPLDEELREVYRAMRSTGQGTTAQLAAACSMEEPKIWTAIEVFAELCLVEKQDGGAWKLLPPRKCELSESILLRKLHGAMGNDPEKKGSK